MENTLINIGRNIRYFRNKNKFSQGDLASLLKVDKAYISRIENGKKNMTLNSLIKIANALSVDVKIFFR